MKEIALGFLSSDRPPPQGLNLNPVSGLYVLGGPYDSLQDDKSRLSALQSCFDLGLDVLPIALRHPVSVTVALDRAENNTQEILNSLERIKGHGQISMTLRKPEMDRTPNSDGRKWLAARMIERKAVESSGRWLEKLVDHTSYPASPLHETRQAMTVCLLVPRRDDASAIDQLRSVLAQRQIGASGELRLSVSGLWPALGFAGLSLNQTAEPI